MKYIRGKELFFETDKYDVPEVAPYELRIRQIIKKRQILASEDWKRFGEELSGEEICDFDVNRYQSEYLIADASSKEDTFLGRFIEGAIAHKAMVSNEIMSSGNILAGFVKVFIK